MTPQEAIITLHGLPLNQLVNIPKEKGIYALADHELRFRYIGSTEGKDFRDRIQNRHITGTESNSHKFSWAYNVGRMYRGPKSSDKEVMADRHAAKQLRNAFIRKYCRAVWMPYSGNRIEIETLERAMIEIAPLERVLWNRERIHVSPPPEPRHLVDDLISQLRLDVETRKRLERQELRHRAGPKANS
ncbi:hypothetical protein [Mameliella alba]|uniref:hypothetical protein n=1 Tax=Mameliella alba TaxID=561184 RepID=UPI00142F57C0|nr:hypothetical protein [Mameliella alba]